MTNYRLTSDRVSEVQINFAAPRDLSERLDSFSKSRKVSKGRILRTALEELLEKEETPPLSPRETVWENRDPMLAPVIFYGEIGDAIVVKDFENLRFGVTTREFFLQNYEPRSPLTQAVIDEVSLDQKTTISRDDPGVWIPGRAFLADR